MPIGAANRGRRSPIRGPSADRRAYYTTTGHNGRHIDICSVVDEEGHYVHSHAALTLDRARGAPSGVPTIAYSVRYLAAITQREGSSVQHYLVHSERTEVYFLVGKATVSLFTANFDEPFPAALERRLVSLIRTRALAAARLYPEVSR